MGKTRLHKEIYKMITLNALMALCQIFALATHYFIGSSADSVIGLVLIVIVLWYNVLLFIAFTKTIVIQLQIPNYLEAKLGLTALDSRYGLVYFKPLRMMFNFFVWSPKQCERPSLKIEALKRI